MKFRLVVLTLLISFVNFPRVNATEHDTHLQPQTVDYALILPANMPHMLRLASSQSAVLGLDDQQRQLIRQLITEAPLTVFSRLQQAEKIEKSIAHDVLMNRHTLADVQARLDQLSRLKREASEAQIATIGQLQAALSIAQFSQLLTLANRPEQH